MSEDKEQKKEEPQQESVAPMFMPRSRSAGDGENAAVPLWLITFTDIMALMLTFFVLLYSMSVPLEEDWEEFTSAMNKGLSKFQSPEWYQGPQDTVNIDKLDFSRALDLDYLESLVRELMVSNERLSNIVVIPQKTRLVLSLPSDLLFEAGQAEVTTKGKRALFAIGGPLSRIRNRIEVIGHADPRPVQSQNSRFSSNWELSLARAANVSAVLENVGYARPIIVRGLSSARYDELPGDLGREERLDLARRVDVVIMKDDGSQRLLFGQ